MNILPFVYVSYVDNVGNVDYLRELVGKLQKRKKSITRSRMPRIFFLVLCDLMIRYKQFLYVNQGIRKKNTLVAIDTLSMTHILPFWYVTCIDNAGDVDYLREQVGKLQVYCSEGKCKEFLFYFYRSLTIGVNDDTRYVLFLFLEVV